MAYIDIIDSTGKDLRYALPEDGSVLLIGSAEDCSISLPHIPDLQPQHCTISYQAEGYVLTALPGASLLAESTPTEAAVLVPHAVYNIGTAVLMYNDSEAGENGLQPTAEPTQDFPQTPEPAPVAQEPAEEEDAGVRKKPAKKLKRTTRGSLDTIAMYTREDSALHIILRRLYVIIILAAAFLAGLTMRYWMISGNYLIDELLK